MNENIPDTLSADGPITQAEHALDRARHIVEEIIAPRALDLDLGSKPPTDAVKALGCAGLLGLTTSQRYGGLGASGEVVRAYTELLASACGTTTFVQGQHLSACNLIMGGQNELLRERMLPLLAKGDRLTGIAFAHVRRPGSPAVTCAEADGGYVFSGTAPWFTGWGVFNEALIAGTLPDGRLVFALMPLDAGHDISSSPPMQLCAMNASATVELTCKNVFVPAQRVMKVINMDQMGDMDLGALLGVTPQIFGVTSASIRLVEDIAQRRNDLKAGETANVLTEELAAARSAADHWRSHMGHEDYRQGALRVRAWCIELGVRAAHAAVTATGGSANDRSNTAQRLFREAMFYTLTAQTAPIRSATLERINEASKTARHLAIR